MKRPLHSIFILPALFLLQSACTHDPVSPPSCADLYITRADVIPNIWWKWDCNVNYLEQYEWKGDAYFIWGNPCIDALPWPIDCEGNSLASSFDDPVIGEFLREATSLGIVGIRYE